MAFALKPERSTSREVLRVFDKQLLLAIRELNRRSPSRDVRAVHAARRHIKKARAVLRLLGPRLGAAATACNRRLRNASRLLGPTADRAAVVDAIACVRRHRSTNDSSLLTSLRRVLVQRARRVVSRAHVNRTVTAVTRILEAERDRAASWRLHTHGFAGLEDGLAQTVRRARRAMAAAEAHPTSANYHRWRKRVKDLWLQIRLLGRRCEGGLRECERQLERLDGLLGDSHNVFLLEQLVAAEPVLPRAQTAQLLHRLRRLQLSLRDEALSQGRATLNERPDEFVRRVRRVWRRRVRQKGLRGSRLWQRAA